MNIGSLIYIFRKQRNMSRRELAKGICDESTIRRIEIGKQEPRLYTLIDICKKLGISTLHLLPLHNKEELLYIQKIKQLCREFVYYQDYDALRLLLETCETKANKSLRNDIDFTRFIYWHKAILDHKVKKKPHKAKRQLFKLLHNSSKLLSEVDIGIANSIGLIQIELNQIEQATKILQTAFLTTEQHQLLEDKTLYIRVGYNYALVQYKKQNYEDVINVCYRLLYYLDSYHLKYMVARIHHLLSINFDKKGLFDESEKHMKKATEYFLAESNLYQYLRSMRALSEVQIKNGKSKEGVETLNIVKRRLIELDDPKELPNRIIKMKKEYGIGTN